MFGHLDFSFCCPQAMNSLSLLKCVCKLRIVLEDVRSSPKAIQPFPWFYWARAQPMLLQQWPKRENSEIQMLFFINYSETNGRSCRHLTDASRQAWILCLMALLCGSQMALKMFLYSLSLKSGEHLRSEAFWPLKFEVLWLSDLFFKILFVDYEVLDF